MRNAVFISFVLRHAPYLVHPFFAVINLANHTKPKKKSQSYPTLLVFVVTFVFSVSLQDSLLPQSFTGFSVKGS